MSKPRLLQISPITPPADARLARDYDVVALWKEADPLGYLVAHGSQFAAAAIHLRFAFDAAMLAALPNLKALCNFGAGYDKIDVAAARARGVQVSNTPGVLDECVADTAIGLLIDAARGFSTTTRFVREGQWKAGKQRPLMTRVNRKNLGLVGYGGIGRAIARRADGFGMTVRYNSRKAVAGAPHAHEPDLLALARWADFLVLACPGGPATRHMINAQVLDALGPQGILVNIARGSVVDEAALVAALKEGRIAGAGLDVYENEPNIPDELLAMDNVTALSHIAGFTRESRADMEALVCDNVDAFFKTGKVLTPV